MPAFVKVMALGLPTIRGNHERQLLTLPRERMGASDAFAAQVLQRLAFALAGLAFQRGDQAAFRVLYERYARAMVAFCHRFVRDDARAEELAQDVFVKLHRAAHRYAPSARFKTFLYRVATNHCLNELRRPEHAARGEALTLSSGQRQWLQHGRGLPLRRG